MRRIIAVINMTLDGFCDHTVMIADEEVHQHFADLLGDADTILYGRVTYQLMQYWQTVLTNPTGIKATDEFAVQIDKISKIVFSRTLKDAGWQTARLARRGIEEEVRDLKQQPGKDVLVGSPSLIVALTQLGLIDEYRLCIHPVIAGTGLPLFKNISDKIALKLIKTKTFGSGTIAVYYQPSRQ
jgi:dihydrofolate reductase